MLEIIKNDTKIAIIIDESTSIFKKSCLIVYLRVIIEEVQPPENLFFKLIVLESQDANGIINSLLSNLQDECFDEAFLTRNLVAFCSDGASVMLGKDSGVATKLKAKFPGIVTWHCLNHRLELCVSDGIKSIDGFFTFSHS